MTTSLLHLRAAALVGLALAFFSNCTPSEVAPRDAAADAPRDLPDGDADAAADGGPADVTRDGPCGDGGVCGGGQRCDPARMRCVDCLAADHCSGSTPVCASGRCVAATPCNSSRMCPGQVCDLAQMRCVDCVTDAECDAGQRCVASVCVAPVTCRSSRDCSAGGLVCNVAQMRCVECLEDRDCAMGSACTTGNVCRVSACTPGARRCVGTTRLATCDMRGVAETEADCATGELCTGGECRRLLCVPGAASCESAMTRRSCNADGMAYTVTACAAGETCTSGECRRPGCTPGAATCTSTTERRVCNADGMTFATMPCPAGQMCSGGACAAAPGCPAGQTLCGAACADLQRDATHCGRCANACPAGAACDAGACAVATASMLRPRAEHALVTLLDGSVLAIGGFTTNNGQLRTVERYDPATNRWEARADLPTGPSFPTAALLEDGRVVVSGHASSQLHVYTPSTNTWARLTMHPTPVVSREAPQVAHVTRGRVYVADANLRMSWYELATGMWQIGPTAVGVLGTVPPSFAVDAMGAVHVFGISDRARRAVFSTVTDAWSLVPSASFGINHERVVAGPDGSFYGAGFFDTRTRMSLNTFVRFDPIGGVVTPLAPMRHARTHTRIVVIPGGRLLVAGGGVAAGAPDRLTQINTAEIYTIATNTWR